VQDSTTSNTSMTKKMFFLRYRILSCKMPTVCVKIKKITATFPYSLGKFSKITSHTKAEVMIIKKTAALSMIFVFQKINNKSLVISWTSWSYISDSPILHSTRKALRRFMSLMESTKVTDQNLSTYSSNHDSLTRRTLLEKS
jgi:hypothetical protein